MRLLLLLVASLFCVSLGQNERQCTELCSYYYDNELSSICRGVLPIDPSLKTHKSCIAGRKLGSETACMPCCAAATEPTGVLILSSPIAMRRANQNAKRLANSLLGWCRRGYEKAFQETRDNIAERALELSSEKDEDSEPAATGPAPGDELSSEKDEEIQEAAEGEEPLPIELKEDETPPQQDPSMPSKELDNDDIEDNQDEPEIEYTVPSEPQDEAANEPLDKAADEPLELIISSETTEPDTAKEDQGLPSEEVDASIADADDDKIELGLPVEESTAGVDDTHDEETTGDDGNETTERAHDINPQQRRRDVSTEL